MMVKRLLSEHPTLHKPSTAFMKFSRLSKIVVLKNTDGNLDAVGGNT